MLSLLYGNDISFSSSKTHFHKKFCALGLILKVRVFGTRKWPLGCYFLMIRAALQFRGKVEYFVVLMKGLLATCLAETR